MAEEKTKKKAVNKKKTTKKKVKKTQSKTIEFWTKPRNLAKVEKWSSMGLSVPQIAKNMGIATSTFYNYQNISTEFLDAVKRGKMTSDVEVENAVRKRAIGYTVLEAKYLEVPYEEDERYILMEKAKKQLMQMDPEATDKDIRKAMDEVPLYRKVPIEAKERHIPGDTAAAKFWLTNRNPDDWKEKQHQSIEADMNVTNKYEELTDEQLEKMAEAFGEVVEDG